MTHVFFTDRDLGKQFPAILRTAGILVEVHGEHFAADTADDEWLPAVGRRGWVVLTHDQRIRYKANERDAVMSNGVAMFVLLSLGAWVPSFLAGLSPQLVKWRGQRSLDAIDDAGPVVPGARFDGCDAECVVVALTHPSLRGPNVRRRRYGNRAGAEAELAMLADARKLSRSPCQLRDTQG